MFYKIEGKPQEDELVLCKVTKIYPNSVFVDLLEFNRLSGMIHISEVSPGRIRNLRDYVSVGRQIVCKILKIDKERGHIVLSLRRVNSNQRREKLDEIKQEIKSEQLIKNVSKKLGLKTKELYDKIAPKVFEEYTYVHEAFMLVVEGKLSLEKLGIDKKIAKEVSEAIIEKFKPKKISIEGEIRLKTYESSGVDKIKKTLMDIDAVSETLTLSYLGAGRYKVVIEDFEYKPAEKNLKKAIAILDKFNNKNSTAVFDREKND